MKRIAATFALLMLASVAHAQGQLPAAIDIAIQNRSFETPIDLPEIVTDPAGCGNYVHDIPGWIAEPLPPIAGGGGVVRWTCGPLPDGSMAAFLGYGMRMVQDLHIPAQPGVYTLTFYVGNWFGPYTGPYAADLWVGGVDIPNQGTRFANPICHTSGYALYEFTPITLVCPMPGYIAPNNGFNWLNFNNGDLLISIDGTGWTVLVDKVSLQFVPQS